MQLYDFRSIVTKYKVVFFDAYGVLKNHEGIIPGTKETFDFLDRQGILYYVLTNDASRGPIKLSEGYKKRGIDCLTPDKIISSGMLAREFVQHKVNKGTVAYLGTLTSAHYIRAMGLETVSIRELELRNANSISALVLLDDEGFQWETDLNKAVNLLRLRNIPVVVANTDFAYPVSQHKVAIAIGGLANMLEKISGKRFMRFGKPDAEIFHFAMDKVQQDRHTVRDEILMVGDTLVTDILGGNKFGIDTALTLTGNTLASSAQHYIDMLGIVPTYVCTSIA